MKQVVILLLALLCLKSNFAQTRKEILVHVFDSSMKISLPHASVILSTKKDSMIVSTGRTDSIGILKIKMPPTGNYLLHVFYSGFDDYTQEISFAKEENIYSIDVAMIPKIKTLVDVVVQNKIAKIKFKGDTIEYRADSFLIDKYANVEELLKKLPGFYIDPQGRILANGKRVEKVLVGGEELFSEDPTLVTRSLRSEMVQKVQLFEQKSDQAKFSKTDDGKSVQAINLELKPDKQKGYLGKIQLSRGTKTYFDEQLMISRFAGSQRIAGYILHSNTGTTGLSWQEQRTFSDFSLTTEESVGNSKPSASILDNWDGQYQGQGLPYLVSSGIQYSDRYFKGMNMSLSGRFSSLGVNSVNLSSLQYFLNDSLYSRTQEIRSNNSILSSKGVLKTTIPISTSSDLVIGVDVGNDKKTINYQTKSQLTNDFIGVLNSQSRSIQTNGNDHRFNGSVLWRKKFGADIRLTLNGKYNRYNDEYSGFLYSGDSLFQSRQLVKLDITDQFKIDVFNGLASSQKVTLTIPFSSRDWISINGSYTFYNNYRKIETLRRSGTQTYDIVDTVFSNQYSMNGNNFLAGIDYGLKVRKISFSVGADGGKTNISQSIGNKLINSRNFILFFPSLSFTYSFNSQHRLVAYYSGQPVIPRVDQLQPIINNADPLNQQLGNSNLDPAYLHRGNVQYYWFLTDINLSLSGGGSFQIYRKGFATNEWIDSFGKRSFKWINSKGISDANLFSYIDYTLVEKWIDVGFNPQFNISNYTHFINGQLNQIRSSSFDLTFTSKIFQNNLFDFENRFTFRKYTSDRKSPIRQVITASNFIWQPSLRVFLGLHTFLRGNFYYTRLPSEQYFGREQNILRLNASISHRFLKQKQLEIRLSGFDILRNNIGVTRSAYSNYTSQQEYNVIGNYWLFSFQYHFSKSVNQKKS